MLVYFSCSAFFSFSEPQNIWQFWPALGFLLKNRKNAYKALKFVFISLKNISSITKWICLTIKRFWMLEKRIILLVLNYWENIQKDGKILDLNKKLWFLGDFFNCLYFLKTIMFKKKYARKISFFSWFQNIYCILEFD